MKILPRSEMYLHGDRSASSRGERKENEAALRMVHKSIAVYLTRLAVSFGQDRTISYVLDTQVYLRIEWR